MTRIAFQLHGLPQELIGFAEACAFEYSLFSVAIVLHPEFEATRLVDYRSLRDAGRIDRICLSITEPDFSAEGALEFSRNNPDCLTLSIGEHGKEGLVESGISALTDKKDAIKIWRKIAGKLRARTSAGAWVVNPHTNFREFYKNHRYTKAAKKAADEGLTMRPLAGWNHFMLGAEERE